MPVFWLVVSCAAAAGLLLGSFLNVCIVRLPRGESVVAPRSRCGDCGGTLRWFENVPLLSYAVLRGRCRSCGAPIEWRYPVVEAATAAWFGFSFVEAARLCAAASAGTDAVLFAFVHAIGLALLGFFLIGLLWMDAETGLLPNEFTIGGLCVGLFFAATESFFMPSVRYKTFFTPEEVFIGRRAGAALAGFVLLWVVRVLYRAVRRRDGMGRGDAKMLAMIGSFLGFAPTVLALVLGVSFAGVAAVCLLILRRADGRTRLPFGSFLAVGGLAAAAVGDAVVRWYLGLYR